MKVVLRCPSCGTTRATPGECEACHEAQVRFFCTAHEPGVWLDGSSCPLCEVRVVKPTRAAPVKAAAVDAAALERHTSQKAVWERLLRGGAALARPARKPAPFAGEGVSLGQMGGCLMRLLLIAVLVIVAMGFALYMFGRSVL